jgi:hypothetical protein
MNLMTFVRLLVLVVVGWTVLALGAGMLGIGRLDFSESTFFVARPSLHDALPMSRREDPLPAEYWLLDQTTGHSKAMALSAQENWSLLSISPWRDKDGKLEAAGRWVCRNEGQEGFCGIGCLTLPDSTVKNRVTLDVFPTGRPCWVYGCPGAVLFPTADGQLYRCNIAGRARENTRDDSPSSSHKNARNVLKARAVAWETKMPGRAAVFLGDPAGSSQPHLGRLIFVSMSIQDLRDGRPEILPPKLWWLVINVDGDAIVNAGRLTVPQPEESGNDTLFERLPSVVTGNGGEISLVYLTKNSNQKLWQLQSAKLEIDAETALPRLQSGAGLKLVAKDVLPSPLVVSASGEHVFAIDGFGQIIKHAIPR